VPTDDFFQGEAQSLHVGGEGKSPGELRSDFGDMGKLEVLASVLVAVDDEIGVDIGKVLDG
jgi:hypothetical protein